MGPVLAERSTTWEMNGPGVNHTPSWNVRRRKNAVYFTLKFKITNHFIAKLSIGGKSSLVVFCC